MSKVQWLSYKLISQHLEMIFLYEVWRNVFIEMYENTRESSKFNESNNFVIQNHKNLLLKLSKTKNKEFNNFFSTTFLLRLLATCSYYTES